MSSTTFEQDGRAHVTYDGREYVFDVFEDPIARTLWDLMEEFSRLQKDYEWVCEQNLANPTSNGQLSALFTGGKLEGLREALDKMVHTLAKPYLKAGDPAM